MDGTNKTENTEPNICKQVELMLSDFIDQVLDEDKKEMVFNHLDSCSVCQTKHAQIKSLVQSLKQMPVIKPARDLSADLEELLARDKASAQVIPLQKPQKQATKYIFSAAAAILLVVLAIYFLTSSPTQIANKGEEVIRDQDSLIAQKNPSGLPTKTNTQNNGLVAENTAEGIKNSFNTTKQQVSKLSTSVQGSDSSEEGAYSLIPEKPTKQAIEPNTNIANLQSAVQSTPTPGNNAKEEDFSTVSDNDNNMEGSTSIASIFDDNAYDSNLGLGLSKDDDGLFDIKI